jgi:hypothetical protein
MSPFQTPSIAAFLKCGIVVLSASCCSPSADEGTHGQAAAVRPTPH